MYVYVYVLHNTATLTKGVQEAVICTSRFSKILSNVYFEGQLYFSVVEKHREGGRVRFSMGIMQLSH